MGAQIYSVHLSSERVSGSQFMGDRLKVMGVSCYAILACLKAIKSLTKDNKDELLALLDDAVIVTEEIQQVLKKVWNCILNITHILRSP